MFQDLRSAAAYRDISVEFYVISGGLQALGEGSEFVQQFFSGFYGCLLGEDPVTGLVTDIKRCVTFTEKTRFLFEICKGITQDQSASSPFAVNQLVPVETRPIPFRNMIYVGDGLTDIPCFSLVEAGGGVAFGVYKRDEDQSAKQSFQRLLETRRVRSLYSPDYTTGGDLGTMLRAAVESVCIKIMLERSREADLAL